MDRSQLADFLRTRRARIGPREAGLPDTGRRRTPGLRRQEVAQLAGMSVDYYIRLEQGRGPRPSRQVLNALARALMLTADERAHLFHLLGEGPSPDGAPCREVPSGILEMLEALGHIPAYVMDAKYDILAWNRMTRLITGDLGSMPPDRLNVIRWCFTSPEIREYLDDEEQGRFARGAVADLRVAAGRYPHDPEIQALVAEMTACSPEFAALWARHDVEIRRDQRKRFHHPSIGTVWVNCQVLLVPDRDQRVVMYTSLDGAPERDPIRALAALDPPPPGTPAIGVAPGVSAVRV
ncbi:transcriptional regulator with XRE-family HTH domain [Thermocatellispora tengchongensis]|uniref:Transcriptional regulator with XRE-family HTH domain n=1 Tax=Thermocatellispora tengchongensis TaxID=1073253 RepID=A0A840P5F9_9ACTN|nr:helix-turn-helix transcriptional regulator [Thermocatellispora tengchongensis]MBB5131265.1 transcriptional regulator with XRE-family HTH domain [Thermocatellispora tengchongensis]